MRSKEHLSEEEREAIQTTPFLRGFDPDESREFRRIVAEGIAEDERNDFTEVYALWDDGEYQWGNYMLGKMFPDVQDISDIGNAVWRRYREHKPKS